MENDQEQAGENQESVEGQNHPADEQPTDDEVIEEGKDGNAPPPPSGGSPDGPNDEDSDKPSREAGESGVGSVGALS